MLAMPRHRLGRTSWKWRILCRVVYKTSTQSIDFHVLALQPDFDKLCDGLCHKMLVWYRVVEMLNYGFSAIRHFVDFLCSVRVKFSRLWRLTSTWHIFKSEVTFSLLLTCLSWWRGTVVERRSLAGELSLSCAWPAANGWPLMCVSHPL